MTEQETVKTEEVAKVNPLERTLDLVVSYASAEELTEKALKNYGKNAKLPGFRKGHVPAAQVRRMYGMQAYDEAINQLVGEAWQKAASESELRIAAIRASTPPRTKRTRRTCTHGQVRSVP